MGQLVSVENRSEQRMNSSDDDSDHDSSSSSSSSSDRGSSNSDTDSVVSASSSLRRPIVDVSSDSDVSIIISSEESDSESESGSSMLRSRVRGIARTNSDVEVLGRVIRRPRVPEEQTMPATRRLVVPVLSRSNPHIITNAAAAAAASAATNTGTRTSSLRSASQPQVVVEAPVPLQPAQGANPASIFNDFGYMECIVCLEPLLGPTAIAEQDGNNGNGAAGDGQGGAGQGNQDINAPGGVVIPNPIQRRNAAASRRENILANIDPREICTTSCGHMYHKYCIQKWFNEQGGRKSCPSCRKSVAAKFTRLFPNIGQDTPPPRRASISGAVVQQGSSQAGGTGQGTGDTTKRPSTSQQTTCRNPECVDLATFHQTLIYDYGQLEARYNGARETADLRTAEMASLQESHDRQTQELEELRKSAKDGPKRRRHE